MSKYLTCSARNPQSIHRTNADKGMIVDFYKNVGILDYIHSSVLIANAFHTSSEVQSDRFIENVN